MNSYWISAAYNSNYREQLLLLLRKFLSSVYTQRELRRLLDRTPSDLPLCEQFHRNLAALGQGRIAEKLLQSRRGKQRFREIRELLGGELFSRITEEAERGAGYLDVGAGEGWVTRHLGKRFGFPSSRTHGVDLRLPSQETQRFLSEELSFHVIKGNSLPFSKEEFLLITCLQSLHHMNEVEAMLKEIHRVLKPGGLLVIREHDSPLDPGKQGYVLAQRLIDVEHLMYEVVVNTSPEVNLEKELARFQAGHFALYRSETGWHSLLSRFGFSLLRVERPKSRNPTGYFWALYARS